MKYSTIRLTEKTILELRKIQESLSETYEQTILKLIKEHEKSRNNSIKK